MSRLSPLLQVALLDQLGIVDGAQIFDTGGNPVVPETIPPTGVERTDIDTGAPTNFADSFASTVGLGGSSNEQRIGIALLAAFGLFFAFKALA